MNNPLISLIVYGIGAACSLLPSLMYYHWFSMYLPKLLAVLLGSIAGSVSFVVGLYLFLWFILPVRSKNVTKSNSAGDSTS